MSRLLPAFASLCLLLPVAVAAPHDPGPPRNVSTDRQAAPVTPMPKDSPLPASAASDAITAAVAGDWRDPEFRARDRYRNPAETLAFFGVEPGHSVVEITPGGGWYAEILAPLVAAEGHYTGAIPGPQYADSDARRDYAERTNSALRERFHAKPEAFADAELVEFDPAAPVFGEPGSADRVLTFRNVHNWRMHGNAEAMFAGFHAVLAPGGVLGVVEHRAAQAVPEDDRSGYVGEDQVIALAQAAGFVLDASSEINANPADTRDHPNGVWTLPPGNRHDEADAATYAAIGESDRMTLRFRKPERGD